MDQKKGTFLFVALLLITGILSVAVCAEVSIPDELLSFYSHDVSSLTLSNNTFVLYDTDRIVFYYLYYNPGNRTLNVSVTLDCTAADCPSKKQLYFDFIQNDETLPFVKKAAGIFMMTNASKLGSYAYILNISDASANYSESVPFTVTVISEHFWTQFWHNLLAIFD